MEKLQDIILNINIQTKDLQPDIIQMIMLKYSQLPQEILWNEVAQTLMKHLAQGFEVFDDQLLCATCYFSILHPSAMLEVRAWKTLKFNLQITDESMKPLAISLMYGMFQSSFFEKKWSVEYINEILDIVFENLISLAFDYAWYTFIVFKTINSFKKVVGTDYQEMIFTAPRLSRMLSLVNNNWENPITGIRRLNISIFQTVFIHLNEDQKTFLIKEIDSFNWNKAKYLMLSEIINITNRESIGMLKNNNWIDGVIDSLFKPGLVSAGTDMYNAILLNLRTEEEWHILFMEKISNVLTGKSLKGIEYFTRYWLQRTLTRFPILVGDMLSYLNSERKYLYSCLCIMKMGNRLNIIDRKWADEQFSTIILQGLEHVVVEIRILSFDIACFCGNQSSSKDFQYDLVFDYLTNNVNSDSTVLRHSMIDNFKLFLQRIHTCWIHEFKNKKEISVNEDVITFYSNVQKLIIFCLNSDGNYQRKIASIKICDTILERANEVVGKYLRPKSDITLMDILNNEQAWYLSDGIFILKLISFLKDPAMDVRENVLRMLLNYYLNSVKEQDILQNIVQDALQCLESKFFFDISCGQKMFELIANILLNTESSSCYLFKKVEDVFFFWNQNLTSEYALQRGIMDSIETGNQLHSFIKVLHAVLDVCLQQKYELLLPEDTFIKLLQTLDGISKQFVLAESPSENFDFSQMSSVVQEIIAKSGYNPCDEKDQSKISGLEQLILNCLWQNVKACCELLERIIRYHKNESDIEICEHCLSILTNVLQTSRHKGIIEVAGVCLGASIRCLTSSSDNNLSKLPLKTLKDIMEIISNPKNMSSVTRRGAGLSIMFHRIVSNDMTKEKVSFHHFMSTILQLCQTITDIPEDYETVLVDMENEKDLPKAIYLHFLTKIVTDSGLASENMRYMEQIAKLAFTNLTSKHWQIRNAALQIYGAVVPRLVGQKKSSGEDEETIATVPCDEFRTHMPTLWAYMLEQLKCRNSLDRIQTHSNLVPVLYLLASTAKRYNFSFDNNSYNEYLGLFKDLSCLLDSPIYTVRRLSAQTIYNTIPFNYFSEFIETQTCITENLLHGALMATALYRNQTDYQCLDINYFKAMNKRFDYIMKSRKHSYFSRSVYNTLYNDKDPVKDVVKEIKSVFLELETFKNVPGVYVWTNNKISQLLKSNMRPNELTNIIKVFLDHPDYELYCTFIYENITKNDYIISISNEILLEMIDIFLKFDNRFNSSIIWETLYAISSKLENMPIINVTAICDYLQTKNFITSFKTRYIIPFVASIILLVKDTIFVENFTKSILMLIDQDFEMRNIAVLANNELGKRLDMFPDSIKIRVLRTTVILLQDEDIDIRNKTVICFKGRQCAPYVLLNRILKFDFLTNILDNPEVSIPILCKSLKTVLQYYLKNSSDIDENNPFNNDSKNIYMEVKIIEKLIEDLSSRLW